ncbi:hypothetical protein RvY_04497 [Ramazzottius varieornatus]|uniref:Cadherin domain-containing protein n=1 Tax=Ramazzottius varieornatus TaxID=947166 RepID=A0A1D1URV4_RAMVA|nr:hypothetical protein RvY_04497 [Ramazzottius varieornatus]
MKMHPLKPKQTDISTLEPKITFVYKEATTPDPLSSDLDPRFIEQVFRQTIPKNSPALPSRTDNPPFNPFPPQFFDKTQNQWNSIDNPIIINLNESQPYSPFGMTEQPVQNMPWMPRDDARNLILPGSSDQPTALALTSEPAGFSQLPMTSIPPWPHRTINPQHMQLGTTNSFRPQEPPAKVNQDTRVNRPGPDSSFSVISGPNSPMKGGPSGPFIAGNPPPTSTPPRIRQMRITPLVPITMTTRGGAVDRQDFDPNSDRQDIVTSTMPNRPNDQPESISQLAQNFVRDRKEGRTREPMPSDQVSKRRFMSVGGFRRRTARPFYAAQRKRITTTTTTTMSPFIASIQIESHPVTIQQDSQQSSIRLPPVWDGKVTVQNSGQADAFPQPQNFHQTQGNNQGQRQEGSRPLNTGQNVGIQLPPVWDGKTSNENKQLNPPPLPPVQQFPEAAAPVQQMNNQQLTNSINIGATPIPSNENSAEVFANPMSRQTTPFVCPCLQNPVGQSGASVTPPTVPMVPQFPQQQMQGSMEPNRGFNLGIQSQNSFIRNENGNQVLMTGNPRRDFGNALQQTAFPQNAQMGIGQFFSSGPMQGPTFQQPVNNNGGSPLCMESNDINIGQNKLGSASFVLRPSSADDPYSPVGRATFEYLPSVNSINTNSNGLNNFPGPEKYKPSSNNEVRNFGMNGNAVITGQRPYPGAESTIIGQQGSNKALQFSSNANSPNVDLLAIRPRVTPQAQPTLPRPTMPSQGFETTTPSQWQPFTPHWSTTIAVESPSQVVSISGLKQLRQDTPENQIPKGPLPIWSYNIPEDNRYQQGNSYQNRDGELIDLQGTQQTITVDIIHPVRRLISVSANTPICAQSQVNLDLDSSTPPNTILGTILAADPGALSLQWSIERDSTGGIFSVNKVTGDFGLIGSLKGINEAKVEVRVANSLGQFCITLVVVRVRRSFDAANGDVESRQMGIPGNSGSWFSHDSFNVTIPCSLPSETLIMQATARHPTGQPIRYLLRGSDEFGLNQTGYVALLKLNLGNPEPFRSFVIVAQDTSGRESTATINVNLDLSTCYGPQFDVAAFLYDVNTDCSGVRPTDEISQIVIVVADSFGRKDTATVRISVFVNCSTTVLPGTSNDAVATTPVEAAPNKWKSLDEIGTDLGDFLMRVPCASPKGTVVAAVNPSVLLNLGTNVPDIRLENTAEFVISQPNGTITAQVDLPDVDTLFNFPLVADGSPFGLGRIVGNITVQVVCDSLRTPLSIKKAVRSGSTEQVSVPSLQVSTFPFTRLDPWNAHLDLTFHNETAVATSNK